MGVSTAVYTVSILFLNDGDRGTLTAFLAANYLIVGLSFLGVNTIIAHWDKGPYDERIRLSTKMSRPGLAAGVALVLVGLVAELASANDTSQLPLLTILLGFFVFVSTLSETIFSAKASSKPSAAYWQHYAYFIIFLALLVLLILTENVGVIEIVFAYLFASIPYLFAKWLPKDHEQFLPGHRGGAPRIERSSAAKLFAGTFAASMQIRIVSIVLVALHGAEYLGKYLVLWLAFEVVEQLYRFVLLTEVHNIRGEEHGRKYQAPWSRLTHVVRVGAPAVILVAAFVFFFAPRIIAISAHELALSVAFLALNYLARLILNYRLNYLQATNQIGFASKISLGNVAVAVSLVSVLPLFTGFSGVALGLLLASLASLAVSIQKPRSATIGP